MKPHRKSLRRKSAQSIIVLIVLRMMIDGDGGGSGDNGGDPKFPVVTAEYPDTVEVVAVYDSFEEAVVRALQEVRAAGGGVVELHESGCGWSQNDTCKCRVTILEDDTGCA